MSSRRKRSPRANGSLSRGPTTPEGKQTSSRNSLRHGVLSRTVVLSGESASSFEALLNSFRDEHQPETPTEETLIQNLAVARWRQIRLISMETAGPDNEIHNGQRLAIPDEQPQDPATHEFIAFRTLTDETRAIELLNRYEARYDRQFRAALTAFLRLRTIRKGPPSKAEKIVPGPCKLYWETETGTHLVVDPDNPEFHPDFEAMRARTSPAVATESTNHKVGSFGNLT